MMENTFEPNDIVVWGIEWWLEQEHETMQHFSLNINKFNRYQLMTSKIYEDSTK